MIAYPLRSLRRLWRDEDGAQLVEFALVLPILLLIFATIVEGGRMFLSYQTVIGGVRDASRYLARVTPRDICDDEDTFDGRDDDLTEIVENALTGESLLPSGITITGVTPSLTCTTGDFRFGTAPVVSVSAALSITFPFGGLFSLATGQTPGTVSTNVADEHRAYGT
ncbi:TadE/TadG family type IV pilus assembly protein [Thioclava pacifica]|nr:TadE/TadG family type IV pilus assembly protein [Thioclava pacifica]